MRSFYLRFRVYAIQKWPFSWNLSSNLQSSLVFLYANSLYASLFLRSICTRILGSITRKFEYSKKWHNCRVPGYSILANGITILIIIKYNSKILNRLLINDYHCHDAKNVEKSSLDFSVEVRAKVRSNGTEENYDWYYNRQIFPSLENGSGGWHKLAPKYS